MWLHGSMSAGPVERLLDLLAEPARVLVGNEYQTAATLAAQEDFATLAEYYGLLSTRASHAGDHRQAQRLLLAERSVARRIGDHHRVAEATHHLAQRHRLQAGFLVAEVWHRTLLWDELDETTALAHARAWRELAAIREVSAAYSEGHEYCGRALVVCDRFPHRTELHGARVRALLQKSMLYRVQGNLDDAVAMVREARRFVETTTADAFTEGLVALREGGLEVVMGRGARALETYRRAEKLFTGVSRVNVGITRMRQITCLRMIGELPQALEQADRLEAEFRAEGDAYRLGQVLLEKAEVLNDLGDQPAVAATLEAACPLYENQTTLEALRWHRHVARNLITTRKNPTVAAQHLAAVLEVASEPERADLTRTMLALSDLLRLSGDVPLPSQLWRAASRAALLAADWQRASLDEPATRWSMHAQREEVYAAGILVHARTGDAAAVAQIAETGRADVLNQILSGRTGLGTLDELRVVPAPADPSILNKVFEVGAIAAGTLRTGRSATPIPDLPLPGHLSPDTELAGHTEVVALVQVGTDITGWWSACTVWTRETGWQTRFEVASPAVGKLLDALSRGDELPQRGITRATWESLGTFLLSHDEIWSGTRKRPRSVLVCPDPRLWQVPIGALVRGGVHLADVAEVALTPSLRTAGLINNRSRAQAGRSPGPAVSILDPRLPGHDLEHEALNTWPTGHVQLPDFDALGTASLLYVNGYGETAGETASLGQTNITLERLANLVLPPVVVLNGCWSGTAASRYGTDPLSLAVGAVLGKADTVIAGTGTIGGIGSALVVQHLLSLLGSGVPVCRALRSAQLRVRDEHLELGPFDWAGLYVMGVDARWTGQAFTSDA
jgi:tetratricopeptide (TPR) repeat protein